MFVEGDERRVVTCDAEAERAMAVGPRPVAQGVEKRLPDAESTTARDDGDRELGRLVVDEAVPGLILAEEPVPGRAHGEGLVDGDEGGVSGPPPSLHVPGNRPEAVAGAPLAPVVGVVEHVAEVPHVLATTPADDHVESLEPPARSYLTAFFTSAAIRFSSAAVSSFSANTTGHIAPSSRFAVSLKPNVA